jgi:hypothetical protein
VKSLQSQVDAFRSGDRYKKMRSGFRKQLDEKECVNKTLKGELAEAHRQTDKVRKLIAEDKRPAT